MNILIAIDGSIYSKKALDYVTNNPSMFLINHHLVLMNVCPSIPGHVARHVSKEVVQDYYASESAKVMDPVKTILTERGLTNYTIDARHGHAAEEIIKAARDDGAGLIVMGTHGHGIFGRALMGSVATRVVAESEVPVLLVK